MSNKALNLAIFVLFFPLHFSPQSSDAAEKNSKQSSPVLRMIQEKELEAEGTDLKPHILLDWKIKITKYIHYHTF